MRINSGLGGHFNIGGFSHRTVWNAEASRVEMYLVSRRTQQMRSGSSAAFALNLAEAL